MININSISDLQIQKQHLSSKPSAPVLSLFRKRRRVKFLFLSLWGVHQAVSGSPSSFRLWSSSSPPPNCFFSRFSPVCSHSFSLSQSSVLSSLRASPPFLSLPRRFVPSSFPNSFSPPPSLPPSPASPPHLSFFRSSAFGVPFPSAPPILVSPSRLPADPRLLLPALPLFHLQSVNTALQFYTRITFQFLYGDSR